MCPDRVPLTFPTSLRPTLPRSPALRPTASLGAQYGFCPAGSIRRSSQQFDVLPVSGHLSAHPPGLRVAAAAGAWGPYTLFPKLPTCGSLLSFTPTRPLPLSPSAGPLTQCLWIRCNRSFLSFFLSSFGASCIYGLLNEPSSEVHPHKPHETRGGACI